MTHEYAPCSLCGGEVVAKLIQYEYRWKGKLFVFEDVPAGVCQQCGEVYFTAETVKAMEKTVLKELKPKRVIQVPVFSYAEVATA
jgi:YgiT-type zinc finger domain-containing protein